MTQPLVTPEPSSPRLLRWAAALTLLPIPIWFVVAAALAPAPAWRARYQAAASAPPGAVVEVAERELQRYWDRSYANVPGGFDVHAFRAEWDTCLSLDAARDIPFMLVSDAGASFRVDGADLLRAENQKRRNTLGEVVHLDRGVHHLRVELVAAGWPSIALLASFDGRAPKPVGSGSPAAGVTLKHPGAGPEPCSAR
jgi:hypothetical protein